MLEELGAGLYGGPYLPSAVLAATALLASPDEGARQELLPGIASGETIAALAFTEEDGSWDPASIRLAAAKSGDGWVLDGHKSFVLSGAEATLYLVVAVADGGLSLFAVDAGAPRPDGHGAADPGPDPQPGPPGLRRRAGPADRVRRRRDRHPGPGAGHRGDRAGGGAAGRRRSGRWTSRWTTPRRGISSGGRSGRSRR